MELKYKVDDKPAAGAMILYSLQWLMIAIPVVITSTFIAPEGETVFYTQKLFAAMGFLMLIQALWGHRLPLISGPAAVLLMGVISARAQGYGTDAIYSSMMAGGILLFLFSFSGLLEKIRKYFTPRIVVAILILIAFTTAKPIVSLVFSDTGHQGLAIIFSMTGIFIMAVANNILKGIWKSSVVIMAMILGSLIYYLFIGFPDTLMADTQPHRYLIHMEPDSGLSVAFFFCYVALLINELGSIQSLGEMVGAERMPRRNKVGTIFTSGMNILTGAAGILGPVDYSLSPGVVASSGCASRYTIIPAAAVMIVIAFCPDMTSLLLTIPQPVMGTMLFYLMATQISAGLNVMTGSKAVVSFKDGMVLGIPIMINILMTFAPQDAIDTLPSLLRPIVANGFVMGIIAVLLLEHIFLKKER